MSKPKKFHNLLFKCLLIAAALIASTIIIVPLTINLDIVRKNIERTVSGEIGGEIKYRRLDLSYFPRPHIVVHKVEILIPESFTIKMLRMKIYPKIFPLFLGRMQADIVLLEYADYFMELPQLIRKAPQPEQTVSFKAIVKAISRAIRGLPEFKLPELKLRVKFGKVNLVDPFGRRFNLREVQAAYHRRPATLDFSIQCKSNLWDQIEISGSLNPLNFKGQGHIRLSQFRSQALVAYLLPDSALKVTETNANFVIDVTLDGSGNVASTVDGSIPLLALRQGEEQLSIKGGRFRGTVNIGDGKLEISQLEMGLDYPGLQATGRFAYDENLQDIQLTLNGSQIDAASVRRVAGGLLGESETIRVLFNIIRGGFVPWMTVNIQGREIADLGKLDNIVIKGRMTQGKIFIPGAELDLVDVVGDALISEGILHGENLEATTGNSSGNNGKMTLGLNEDLAPFHLKIDVNADLSQLPPVLNRVVRNKDFLAELALIEDVTGTAKGRLTLGDDLATLNAHVQAFDIRLTARYERIPYAIEIDGGKFNYGGSRLDYNNFKANIGKSSLFNSSITVDWHAAPSLSSHSPSAKFNLNELYAWLLSIKQFKKNLTHISELKGDITVTNLNIKGPFFDPRHWLVQTRGVVKKLTLTSKKLNKPLRIGQGQFTWHGRKFTFNGVDAAMGKSSIRSISGDVAWTNTPEFSIRTGQALFDPEDMNPFIFSNQNIATALERLEPISGSLSFRRITASGPLSKPALGNISFSADIEAVKLDAKGLPGSLRADKGNISLRRNRLALKGIDASLGKSTISQLSAGFDLSKSRMFEVQSRSVRLIASEIYPWLMSFDKIESFLTDFSVSKGMIFLSDIKIQGPLHSESQWHYAMTGNINNLALTSDAFGGPISVVKGSFHLTSETTPESVRNTFRLADMDLTWGDNHLTLIGGFIISKKESLLDLSLSADSIDWDQVEKFIDFVKNKRSDPESRLSHRNLLGNLKIQVDSFNYKTYSVSPLTADLKFNPAEVIISVNKAVVCSISIQGQLKINAQTLEIVLVPTAINQSLAPAVACVTDQENLAMGTFSLNGQLLSTSKPDDVLQAVSGELAFSAEKGRIYRFGLLAKILSILNVTEIYRGEIPDLIGEGFAYHGMTIGADIENGKLIMRECSIDGVSMGIACEGHIDFSENKMDLILLVAPFKTADRIVKMLPLIKHILGGKLISIPFRASGDLKNPNVIPLHPTAVGSGVLGVLERTLKLPITIMQPVFSSAKGKKNNQVRDENRDSRGPP